MNRGPRSVLDLVKPDLKNKMKQKQSAQKAQHDRTALDHQLQVGESVYTRNLPSGKTWLKGTVSEIRGPVSFVIEIEDGRLVRRHVDHIWQRTMSADPHPQDPDSDFVVPIQVSDVNPTRLSISTERPTRSPSAPDYYHNQV